MTQLNEQRPGTRPSADDGWLHEYDVNRRDEADDAEFYKTDRMVAHLDGTALRTVSEVIGGLLRARLSDDQPPVILDLMASWNSHLPGDILPGRMTGLGMNANELAANPALDEHVIHDLNTDPRLPFGDSTFDAVLNVVSVDYLIHPWKVFREIGRVLKPGGLLAVVFSNRFFPTKVTRAWREASEPERMLMVQDLFGRSGAFGKTGTFVSQGKPRPADDKYADTGLPSDPVYAVWAVKADREEDVAEPELTAAKNCPAPPTTGDMADLSRQTAESLRCPHCGSKMKKWMVPQTPFTQWDTDHLYVCMHNTCPYLVRGWEAMNRRGNRACSHRQAFNPLTERLMPLAVPSLGTLRDGIVEEADQETEK